jgi:hypothetical protein
MPNLLQSLLNRLNTRAYILVRALWVLGCFHPGQQRKSVAKRALAGRAVWSREPAFVTLEKAAFVQES